MSKKQTNKQKTGSCGCQTFTLKNDMKYFLYYGIAYWFMYISQLIAVYFHSAFHLKMNE